MVSISDIPITWGENGALANSGPSTGWDENFSYGPAESVDLTGSPLDGLFNHGNGYIHTCNSEDKTLPSLEELLLHTERAQERQAEGLRQGGDTDVNADTTSSTAHRSINVSSSEDQREEVFLGTPPISIAGSEARYYH